MIRIKTTLLLPVFIFAAVFTRASAASLILSPKEDSVEMTEMDFVKQGAFNGSHATFFGIALGMGHDRVKQIVAGHQNFKLKPDPFNDKRLYLEEVSNDTVVKTIAYLVWPNYDSGLYQIILYPYAAKYLHGLSCSILTPSSVDPESEIYKIFLGAPTGKQVTFDMPAINSKTTMLYYPKWNIVIEESKTEKGTEYWLVLTHKW